MDKKQLPRGLRNCNPLNIVKSDNNWLGKIKPSADPVFEQFVSIEMGIRAAVLILKSYIKKHRVDTIAAIIHRWAPDGQKQEAAYIKFVTERMQLPANFRIDYANRNHVTMLLHAMAWFECGQEISYQYFYNAYALANRK